MTTSTAHAVFQNRRARVTVALPWDRAQAAFERLTADDPDSTYEVRSLADPAFASLPFVDPDARKLGYVKLSRPEREHLLNQGRRAGDLLAAKDVMLDALLADPRWEHLEAEVVSDYAYAAAKFCFPQEVDLW